MQRMSLNDMDAEVHRLLVRERDRVVLSERDERALHDRLRRAARAENATQRGWLRRGFFVRFLVLRPVMALGLVLAGAGMAAAIVKIGPGFWSPKPPQPTVVHSHKTKMATPAVVEEPPAVVEVGGETREALRAEIALIGRARRALSAGSADEAARLLASHANVHSTGVLIEERQGLLVMTLWHQGKRVEAEQAAQRFVERYPQSPMNRPIRELLDSTH
jgi:hypothetical protein